MACPHTTGVLAQLLEKQKTHEEYESSEPFDALICDSVKNHVVFPAVDSISRNVLLHVPGGEGSGFSNCILNTECSASCSGNGLCLSSHNSLRKTTTTLTTTATADNKMTCHCDPNWYGEDCSLRSDPVCSQIGSSIVLVEMKDGAGGFLYYYYYYYYNIFFFFL
jgi:hypothetical protein